MKKCSWYIHCPHPISTSYLVILKGSLFSNSFFSFYFQAISEKGYVKRMKPDTFNLQNRGTIGKSVGKLRLNDTMSDFLVCHAHDHVLYFRYLSTPTLIITVSDLFVICRLCRAVVVYYYPNKFSL